VALILNIETATSVCSVALSKDGSLLALRESTIDKSHSSLITVFIQDIFSETNYSVQNLDAVAVSAGPGSYTGLRIGASVAKGLCYAADLPLIAIDTLAAMATGVQKKYPDVVLFCPMLDARRMEVFCGGLNKSGEYLLPAKAMILDSSSFDSLLSKYEILFFGSGATKFQPLISNNNAFFDSTFSCSAAHMIPLSIKAFGKKLFEDMPHFEPHYLKAYGG